ncbi:MAG: flagellar protein FliS [Lachnospiraceae bacterium]
MNHQKKQEFTKRITTANRSQLVLILYEMAETYLMEAREAGETQKWEDYKRSIRNGEAVIGRLMEDLNFEQEIAVEFYRLYRYCLEEAAKAKITRNIAYIEHIQMVLSKLTPGIMGMIQADHSEPLMKHIPQVIAGMTYQKGYLTETYQDPEQSRGYLV